MLTKRFCALRRRELRNTFLTSRRTTVSVVKQPSSDINQFFAGHCPMSGVNIQA